MLQWNAQERRANEMAARLERDVERKKRWAKRAEFKKAFEKAAEADQPASS